MIASHPTGNHLTERSLAALDRAFISLTEDAKISRICLISRADVFLAGVDPQFFMDCILAGDIERLLSFTRAAHALLARIEGCDKPITAWVNGTALGAGLELALACHRIIAAQTAKFVLPETGLGIYPGMGGTQRTPRRIGIGLAKWMIYTGAIVPASQALEIGLIDAVHPISDDLQEPPDIRDASTKSARLLSERFQTLERVFAQHDVATLCDSAFPMPADPQAVRAVIQMRAKAPIALRLAEQVIDRGMTLPLSKAIEEEFSHLREIFATADARTGLASIGKQRPSFVGK